MKRDVDLCRQLLLDIESHAADCSLNTLRSGLSHEADERVRYHLRLLIDAGLVKEIDRTTSGVPCVRLTNAGQELIELARAEGRWREAKWIARERTGGLSLTVIRALLTRWAVEAVSRSERYRRAYRPYRPALRPSEAYRPEAWRPEAHRWESYAACRDGLFHYDDFFRGDVPAEPRDYAAEDGPAPPPRPRGDYADHRDRNGHDDRFYDRYYDAPCDPLDAQVSITLPISVV